MGPLFRCRSAEDADASWAYQKPDDDQDDAHQDATPDQRDDAPDHQDYGDDPQDR